MIITDKDVASNSNEVLMGINDSLVYIDRDVSEQLRDEVNELIRQEISQMNTTVPHPSLEDRFDLSTRQDFAFLQDIYKLEEDAESGDLTFDDDDFTIGGIDMNKYQNLTTEDNALDYNNLFSSLSHSVIRRRSLTLSNINREVHKNKWLIANENLSQYNEKLETQLHEKRKAVEEINVKRKKQQLEYQPTDEFLQNRWQDAVKGCVEVGVECAKIEMETFQSQDGDF